MSYFISVFSHSCSVLYLRLVDCIGAKCLTKFQSRLGMVRLNPKVDFWFIIFVDMYLMDSLSYNNFWEVDGIMG